MDIFLSVNQADLLISHHSINIHRRIPANTTRLPLMIQLIFSQLPHLVLTHRQSNAAMGVMEGAFLWALTLKQRLASVSKRLMETDICPADLTADVPCKKKPLSNGKKRSRDCASVPRIMYLARYRVTLCIVSYRRLLY